MNSLMPRLRQAITEAGTPPCIDCQNYSLCASRDLSCEAFFAFVNGSAGSRVNAPERSPSKAWWREMFNVRGEA